MTSDTTAVPVRLAELGTVLASLAAAVAAVRLWPHTASLRARSAGRDLLLMESGDESFLNQIGRALVRARECNGTGGPTIYRVDVPRRHRLLVAVCVFILLVGITAIALTACDVPGVLA